MCSSIKLTNSTSAVSALQQISTKGAIFKLLKEKMYMLKNNVLLHFKHCKKQLNVFLITEIARV